MCANEEKIGRYAELALAGDRKPFGLDYIIIGSAPLFLSAALSLPQETVIRLSAQTIFDHLHHAEATAAIYAAVPKLILTEGLWARRRKDRRISAYLKREEKFWEMGIKMTAKAEIYIPTLHLCEERRFKKAEKQEILSRKAQEGRNLLITPRRG